jgi:CHAT domain-containing protein/tetratricopeptide (TPR) repeat protein
MSRQVPLSASSALNTRTAQMLLLTVFVMSSAVAVEPQLTRHLHESGGAIIESVAQGLPASRAGLRIGDVVVSMRPVATPASPATVIQDPFVALVRELQWSRVQRVVVAVRRARVTHNVTMSLDDWGVRWRPLLPADLGEKYSTVIDGSLGVQATGYCEGIKPIANELDRRMLPRESAWLHWRCAELQGEAMNWARSDEALQQALAVLAKDPEAAAALWFSRGAQALRLRGLAQMESAADNAAALSTSIAPDSPLNLLSELAKLRVDLYHSRYGPALDKAAILLERCHARYPGTLVEATIRNMQALLLRKLERLDSAVANYRQVIDVRSRLAPNSLDTAGARNNYGMALRATGDSAGAMRELTTAVAIIRATGSNDILLAQFLNNLALIYRDRGDLIEAEKTFNEALAIQNRLVPDGYDVAVTLQNLTSIALDRDDTASAMIYADKSQKLFELLAPQDDSVAIAHNLRGEVVERQGDLAGADAEYRRAISLWEHISPGSSRQAWSVQNLGGTALKRGDKSAALKYYSDSLSMRQNAASGSQDEAHDLVSLGTLRLDLGDLDEARPLLERAVSIYSRIAPGSPDYARALHALGRTLQRQGYKKEAIQPLCEAEHVLDLQRQHVSASREVQAELLSTFAEIPRACAQARIDVGDAASAFDVIEQSRARALRERMQFREDAVARSVVPASLREQRGDLNARRAHLEGELASLYRDSDTAKRDGLRPALVSLEQEEAKWFRDLYSASPRYARAMQARVESGAEVIASLAPDTVILVYIVGDERSHILSVSAEGIHAYQLPDTRQTIQQRVQDIRRRITAREPRSTLDLELRHLYTRWMGPADSDIARVRRVLILSDGPLQLLPFAALQDPDGLYAAKRWALTIAPSVSVAMGVASIKRGRLGELVAVAVPQPHFSSATTNSAFDLSPLPGAEREVRAAATLYKNKSEVFVGQDASESRVRTAAQHAGVLHIAAHGYFDPAHPIDSALLLNSGPGGSEDDGVVHAWEVMASWQLATTDLVVLSACDTGVGGDVAGEGLIGLTRAFQYAGAKGVVATLWPITDQATSRIMQRLHANIVAGKRPSDALREAQIPEMSMNARGETDSIRRGAGGLSRSQGVGAVPPFDPTHPYYWAGIEVFGEMP